MHTHLGRICVTGAPPGRGWWWGGGYLIDVFIVCRTAVVVSCATDWITLRPRRHHDILFENIHTPHPDSTQYSA